MPTDAAKRVDKKTTGPAGTASQRATKTVTKGRETTASKAVAKSNKLPDSQGT